MEALGPSAGLRMLEKIIHDAGCRHWSGFGVCACDVLQGYVR